MLLHLPSCKLSLATANQNHHVPPRNAAAKQLICPVLHTVNVVVMKIVLMNTKDGDDANCDEENVVEDE